MLKKTLEAQKTYTMISQEHLSTMDRRRKEEARKQEGMLVHSDNFEPVSPRTFFIQREIQPLSMEGG